MTAYQLSSTPVAKWVKQNLYCAMTGHTVPTLKQLRFKGVFVEGKHYKSGPSCERTYYYDHAAIDKLIDKAK
jgi:hypothetical protein